MSGRSEFASSTPRVPGPANRDTLAPCPHGHVGAHAAGPGKVPTAVLERFSMKDTGTTVDRRQDAANRDQRTRRSWLPRRERISRRGRRREGRQAQAPRLLPRVPPLAQGAGHLLQQFPGAQPRDGRRHGPRPRPHRHRAWPGHRPAHRADPRRIPKDCRFVAVELNEGLARTLRKRWPDLHVHVDRRREPAGDLQERGDRPGTVDTIVSSLPFLAAAAKVQRGSSVPRPACSGPAAGSAPSPTGPRRSCPA